MRARTHQTDEKRVRTSSHSGETINVEEGKQSSLNSKSKANRKLEPEGLTVGDIAGQSAYEDDKAQIAEQIANSDRED